MPTERIAMRRVREMLRLTLDGGLTVSEVARRMGVARSTLRDGDALRALGLGLAAALGRDRRRPGDPALWRGRDQAGRESGRHASHPVKAVASKGSTDVSPNQARCCQSISAGVCPTALYTSRGLRSVKLRTQHSALIASR